MQPEIVQSLVIGGGQAGLVMRQRLGQRARLADYRCAQPPSG